MSAEAAIRTGIRSLDEILLGGISKGNTILVSWRWVAKPKRAANKHAWLTATMRPPRPAGCTAGI